MSWIESVTCVPSEAVRARGVMTGPRPPSKGVRGKQYIYLADLPPDEKDRCGADFFVTVRVTAVKKVVGTERPTAKNE